jgi:ribonucleoside-triphosphate reductase
MRERLSDYQEQYGDLYNLEATPAESTTYRMAKHDVRAFPNIITAAKEGETPYYTNSSHLPVSYTEDIFAALDIQDELQTLYTSGTVFHAFIGEKMPDWKSAANLVRKIAENYQLPYYTLSPTYSVCSDHGYIKGEKYECPICGQKTEVYSRITGYYRPVQNWNAGKSQEFKSRKLYDVNNPAYQPKGGGCQTPECDCESKETQAPALSKMTLFTTATCPRCKQIKAIFAKGGVDFDTVDCYENIDLVNAYSVTNAPTLVVPTENGVQIFRGEGEIRKFYDENLR